MTSKQIALRLAELCRQGKFEEAQTELFSNDAERIEPAGSPGLQTEKGLDAIKEKGKKFQSLPEEVHGITASDPVVEGNRFSFALMLDATMKGPGCIKMKEMVVNQVKDGKIIREQFFFSQQLSSYTTVYCSRGLSDSL